jgi:NitT/TauT family transport system permease protein
MKKPNNSVLHVLAGFAVLIIIWQVAVSFGHYNPALFPAPRSVVSGIGELIANGVLYRGIAASMYRFGVGYGIAVILGIITGLILGWLKNIWPFVNPIVQILRPISPIAWLPFVVLWFGIGDLPAILIVVIAGFFPVLLSTVSAVVKIDPTYLKIAKNFGIRQPALLTKIVFPAAFPHIATGLHLALGTAWVFLVAGEMVGAQSGLGYLIIDSRNNFRADHLTGTMLTIGLLGLLLDGAIRLLEKWVARTWNIQSGEKGAD